MHSTKTPHFDLVSAAHADMIEHGFQPDFPAGTDSELAKIKAQPALPSVPGAQDLRGLLWSSIDNDTSKDLDQIEWAEQLADGRIRVLPTAWPMWMFECRAAVCSTSMRSQRRRRSTPG